MRSHVAAFAHTNMPDARNATSLDTIADVSTQWCALARARLRKFASPAHGAQLLHPQDHGVPRGEGQRW
jgi:hypothetical protein